MDAKERAELRTLIADYKQAEGCSCCRDIDRHEEITAKLAKLLKVPKYKDGSGYDFHRYRSEKGQLKNLICGRCFAIEAIMTCGLFDINQTEVSNRKRFSMCKHWKKLKLCATCLTL